MKKWKIKQMVQAAREKNITILIHLTRKFEICDLDGSIYKVLKNIIMIENFNSDEIPKVIFDFLLNKKLIIKNEKNYNVNDINTNNLHFYSEAIKNDFSVERFFQSIVSKKILIIGCGGVGTVVLDNLLRQGFRNFILIDGDTIKRPNLNRQLFFTKTHINQKKVLILKNEIENNYEDANILVFDIFINSTAELEKILFNENICFIVNCADKPPQKIIDITLGFAIKRNVPYITGGVGIDSGWWGPIIDDSNKFDNDLEKYKISATSNIEILGSSATTNSLISCLISNDIINYFLRKDPSLYRKKSINFLNYEVKFCK